tara:strand:+ start:319 stop:828 length:510 start_codon:yes stop_codon:yes gene_type:complete
MSETRTYKDYKEFFDKVNESNENETYHYSYLLLFSFLENRIQRLFEGQAKIRYGRDDVKIKEQLERQSLYWKLDKIDKWGLVIQRSTMNDINTMSKRRNRLVHEALFNTVSVSKEDVDLLYSLCRDLDGLRWKQKKDPKNLQQKLKMKRRMEERRRKLKLSMHGRLPKF